VTAHVHGLDSAVTPDLDRGAQELQHDAPGSVSAPALGRELAQKLDVLAGGERALLLEPAPRDWVELDLLWIDPQLDPVQLTQLPQLGARERRLCRASSAEHHDLLATTLP